MASQTPFTALFCSALLCVGCCCINNTLRADQRRERKRKREDEMREAITAERKRWRGRQGGRSEVGGKHWGRWGERERKEKDVETQLIRVILDVQEEERAKRKEVWGEVIERAWRIIEPYMVTVKYEAI